MELGFIKTPVACMRRNLWQTQDREFTQELRLGDDVPDIGSILSARGQCIIRGKEWMGDSVGVSGGVMVWILYAPADGGSPCCVEAWVPVQAKWPMMDSHREGAIRTSWLLRGVDARCISARKMMIRADVSLLTEALEPWETEVYAPERLSPDIQLLRRSYPATVPKEAGEKLIQLEEEPELPSGSPPIRKICAIEANPQLTEQRVMGDKAVVRGDLSVHMLYEGTDGHLQTADFELPISQFTELDRDYDKAATLCVMMALSSLEAEPVENRVRLKCGMVAQYVVWDQMLLELVEDAYSLSQEVEPQMGTLELPVELDRCRNTLRCEVPIPVEATAVVDTWAGPAQPRIRRAGGLTELELWGNMGALYRDEEGQLRGCSGQWSSVWELPAGENGAVMAMVSPENRPEAAVGDGLTLGMDLTAQVLTAQKDGLPMVTGLNLGEKLQPDAQRPSLIVRRAGDADLWELAKTGGSTVDAIRRANALTGEPSQDQILLIPVY